MPDGFKMPAQQAIAPPAMDRLANVAKFATVPNNSGTSSPTRPLVSFTGNNNQQGKFLDWWNSFVRKNQERLEGEKRSKESLAQEKELGLAPLTYMMDGKPASTMEELGVGLNQGLTGLGQLVAGVGSMIGVPGSEARRNMYRERGEVMSEYRKRFNPENIGLTPGDVTNRSIQFVPELYNPVNKPGLVAKGANAIWHAMRGYLPNKSLKDAAVSSVSSALGEKAEDLVTKGKGLVGNTVGALSEEMYNYLYK